ncbi:hypothetical protein FOL47_003751 [Perkinsus chesapeaki]|uniref:Uncharacterized protein n=1 Tax=Perkinsus chesapeaki TaxID=330153 RepID=A0A7J6KNJ0_PERCH|nr:hypothetical protein FOL47_003751 [Perkinsus chesapeaki]
MLFAVVFTQLIIITPAWHIPDGEFHGQASNPYINLKCRFNTAGPKPTVVIEANCDGREWHKTVDPLELKTSTDKTFVIANLQSGDYEELIDYLNFKCPGQRFTSGDFATFKVTSVGNQLKINEEKRWVDIYKAR